MATRAIYVIPEQITPLIQSPFQLKTHKPTIGGHTHYNFKIKAAASSSSKKDELPLITRKRITRTARRSLITIATSDGKWQGKWTSDYIFSLEKLRLADLVEDEEKDTEVFISLTIEKHAGFGFSVDGRIITSFTGCCSNCSSSYCREINTSFDVWILPSIKEKHSNQLPVIGSDDPQVIYVNPGDEADLDSLIQDAIRLTTSVNETCSEACEKAEPKVHYFGTQEASMDGRWSRLLELKKKL